jgi:hypothetical protein
VGTANVLALSVACGALALAAPHAARAQVPPAPAPGWAPPPAAAPPFAAPSVPAPPAAAAPPFADDVVVLADGTELRGRVVRQIPGQLLVVRDASGRELFLPWSGFRRVVLAPRPPGVPDPAVEAPIPGAVPPGAPAAAGATPPPRPPTPEDEARARKAKSLVTWGLVSLGVGYGLALIGGGATLGAGKVQQASHGASCFDKAALAFIPLGGPIAASATFPRHTVIGSNGYVTCGDGAAAATAFGVGDGLLQFGGVALMLASLVVGHDSDATPEAPRAGRWVIRPSAPGSSAGLSAIFTWF